jgi:N,N'-diacetyllegionaminate synthase
MGTPRRIIHKAENARRFSIRRSVFLDAPVKAGQRLHDAKVLFRRPGYGLGPDQYEAVPDAKFRRDLPAGHNVTATDLE